MRPALRAKGKRNGRLAASDWVDAALLIMARNGIADVRIEALATRLNVTKGSFYWHFKDRDALFDAMLVAYELRAREFMGSVLASAVSPVMRLRSLLDSPNQIPRSQIADTVRMELAIRSWAGQSTRVRKLVRRADAARWQQTLSILELNGVDSARVRLLNNVLQALLFHLWTRADLSPEDKEGLIEFFVSLVA